MQVFGANAWVEVGDVEHLTTWELRYCPIDRANIGVKQRPQVLTFDKTSTERAELEHFAEHVAARRPLVLPGGDAVHNVAVLRAIMESIESGLPTRLS